MSPGLPLKRVAIIGAESTGKSTLAPALAARYGTVWVPEYLREFVETQKRVPFEHDQIDIARTQRARENAVAASRDARRFLFCDTTPLVTAVYSRIYWGRVPPELLALEAEHDYAATLVAGLDLPWVPDGLQRESEEVRRQVHEALLAVLRERGIPFTLLEGDLAQRLRQVEDLLGPP
jgi:NadR type nicotinamide-nucleotide adenylyltransferase